MFLYQSVEQETIQMVWGMPPIQISEIGYFTSETLCSVVYTGYSISEMASD